VVLARRRRSRSIPTCWTIDSQHVGRRFQMGEGLTPATGRVLVT